MDGVRIVGFDSISEHAVSAVWAAVERRLARAVANGILECASRGAPLCELRIGDDEIDFERFTRSATLQSFRRRGTTTYMFRCRNYICQKTQEIGLAMDCQGGRASQVA